MKVNKLHLCGHSAGTLICHNLETNPEFEKMVERRITLEPIIYFKNIFHTFNQVNTYIMSSTELNHMIVFNSLHNLYFQYRWPGWYTIFDYDRDINGKCTKYYDILCLAEHDQFIKSDLILNNYKKLFDKIFIFKGVGHGYFNDYPEMFDPVVEYLEKIDYGSNKPYDNIDDNKEKD